MAGKQQSLVSGLFILQILLYFHGTPNAQQLNKRTFKKTFMEAATKCSREVGTPSAMSVTYLTSPERTDRNSKCFTLCILTKFNMMDKQGKFDQKSIQTFLNSIPTSRFKDSLNRNLAACLQENANDPCDKAYKFIQCFYRKA